MPQPFNPFEEVPSPKALPSNHHSPTSFLDPHADLCFLDGRRFRILQSETCVREGEAVRQRFGSTARFAIELEVQLVEFPCAESLCGQPLVFWVVVDFDALRSGVLEAHGYGATCERPIALLLIGRAQVHHHLARAGVGGRFSTHTRPCILWAPPLNGDDHDT